MTSLDSFPVDQNRIIKSLEQRIEALETLVRTATGAPVTKASSSFFVPNSSPSATPSGGFELFGSGGDFRVRTSSGTTLSIPGVGAAVADPDAFSSVALGSGATVLGASFNLLRQDAFNDHNQLINLLDSLRGEGIIAF